MKKRILIVFGTRPEALKFAPVIKALKKNPKYECIVCLTGQHREMLDQVIQFFKIPIDVNLKLMKSNQSLAHITTKILSSFESITKRFRPDLLFVQGDTTTAFVVSLASFYLKIPVAHLEAGLRSNDKFHPYPEELNRKLISQVADFHFTPTRLATKNLLHEGIKRNRISEVGNTIVDTVTIASHMLRKSYPIFKSVDFNKRVLFVTAHRRESFGKALTEICGALKEILRLHPDVEIVYPVHLNPNVSRTAHKILGKVKRAHLLRPLTYEETCWLMDRCSLILTDSGGLQEEAPSFRKPVLVLRDVTERPEGIQAGVAKLVGTDRNRIVQAASALLRSNKAYQKMCARKNPYGDGKSAGRIIKNLSTALNGSNGSRA